MPGMGSGNFGITQIGNGKLSFSWDDATLNGVTQANGTILFTIRFTIVGTQPAQTGIAFNSSLTTLEVVNTVPQVIPSTSVNGNILVNGPAPACAISAFSAGTQTACVPATNTYTKQITVTYANAPVTGNLQVNGQNFAITTSPQTVTLTNLVANGLPVNLSASFSTNPTCSFSQNNVFTAPVSCAAGGTFNFFADSVSGATGSFVDVPVRVKNFNQILSVQGTLEWNSAVATYNSLPVFGLPNMSSGNFGVTQVSAGKLAFSWDDATLLGLTQPDSTIIFTVRFNLIGNNGTATPISFGNTVSIMEVVNTTGNPILFTTTNGNISIFGPCSISGLTAGVQTACVPATNTYTQQVTVTFTNAPTTGTLIVNGQSFAIGTSPRTVTLTNLVANGQPVTGSASFSSNPACVRSQNNLFTAPLACSIGGIFTFYADSVQGPPASFIDVPVRVRNFNQILSIQGTIAWNPAVATFNNVSYFGMPGMGAANFGLSQTGNGLIAFSWDDLNLVGVTLPDTTLIFKLRFTLTGSSGAQTAISFVNTISPVEVVNISGNPIVFSTTNGNIIITGGCTILSVAAGSQSACVPATNYYTQNLVVTTTNAPGTGNLVINGQTFPVSNSPQTITLSNLNSNGQPVNVFASFSASPGCSLSLGSVFTAPVNCYNGPTVTLFGDSVQGAPATYVYVPIRVRTFTNILSIQGTVLWNTAVATFDSISYMGLPQMANGNFGIQQVANGMISFSWDDANVVGVTVPDSTIIFTLKFLIVGTSGNQTPVSFGNNITPLEAVDINTVIIPINTINGNILVSGGAASIAGQCISPSLDSIRTDSVLLTGTTSVSLMTGTNGRFSFNGLTLGGNYTVTPKKRNDVARTNGVTALDVALVKRHVLAISILNTPYKIYAADVNSSNQVTALDAALMQRFVLGIDTIFSGLRLWKYIPVSHVFALPTNPWSPSPPPNVLTYSNLSSALTNQDFYGMKLGDVNASWNPATPKTIYSGKMKVWAEDAQANENSILTVPVKVADFNKLLALQFSVTWDKEVLTFLSLENKNLPFMFGEQWANEGLLTAAWVDEMGGAQTLADGSVIFNLKFKIKARSLSQTAVQIVSDFTLAEAYDTDLNILQIETMPNTIKISDSQNDCGFPGEIIFICQNYPNPFTDKTQIRFSILNSGNVRIRIHAINGQTLLDQNQPFEAGYNEFTWDGKDHNGHKLSSGTYILEMESNGKMVTNRIRIY